MTFNKKRHTYLVLLEKMIIREFYLNEETGNLYIEFSTEEDGDDFYRILELTAEDVDFYSPSIIDEDTEIDEDFISEIIIEYLNRNDLPGEEIL
jgi:hypothetical protein